MSFEEKKELEKMFYDKLIFHKGYSSLSRKMVKIFNLFSYDIRKELDSNNPYNILNIIEREYSKEELLEIVNNRINTLLDAYNSIINDKKLTKTK